MPHDAPDFTSATATDAVTELLKEGAGGKDEANGRGVTLAGGGGGHVTG